MGTNEGPDRLSTLIQLREKTDILIEPKWIWPALASYVLWVVYAFIYFTRSTLPILDVDQTLGLVGTLAFATSTGLSFLVYNLISRENKHAERAQEIIREALHRIQSGTSPQNMAIQLPLSSAEQDFASLLQKSRRHSAILWALLVMIPYLGWVLLIVVLYLLTQSSNTHGKSETLVLEDLERTLVAGGAQHMTISTRLSTSRSSLAFVLASFVTFGIVPLSWLYVMIIGEQAHFSYHSSLEPELLNILSTIRFDSARLN